MQELETTWPRVLAVWWLIIWRGLVGAFLLGVALGATITLVGLLTGVPRELIHSINLLLGTLAGIVFGIIAVRMALRKRYRGFRLALVPIDVYDHISFADDPAERPGPAVRQEPRF
jgi:hypothetical protein